MNDPAPRSTPRWLWPAVLTVLAILILVWAINPVGDTDEPGVNDPIVTGDMSDPDAPDAAGAMGEGLPGAGENDPVTGDPPADSDDADPDVVPPESVAPLVPPAR